MHVFTLMSPGRGLRQMIHPCNPMIPKWMSQKILALQSIKADTTHIVWRCMYGIYQREKKKTRSTKIKQNMLCKLVEKGCHQLFLFVSVFLINTKQKTWILYFHSMSDKTGGGITEIN